MGATIQVLAAWLFMFLATPASVQSLTGAVFDVKKYGAVGDGNTDDTMAFRKAFKDACSANVSAKVLVPDGKYLIDEVEFKGPCRYPLIFKLKGVMLAPQDPDHFKEKDGFWIAFSYMKNFELSGTGVIDGQGEKAWSINHCGAHPECLKLPINIRLDFLQYAKIRGITSKDSKYFHFNVLGCNQVTFDNIAISAPAESINTDGIHVGRSENIHILNSKIETGDDCVSVGDGTKNLHVTNTSCGPGHGISIGSLGKYYEEDPVVGIYVKNCTLNNSDNGIRLKTWPAAPTPGIASEMHFDNIKMINVTNPVLIDQEYCPYNKCNLKIPSTVQLSHISFKNIKGTSATPEVVKLACSRAAPCQDVKVGDIHLTYNGDKGAPTFSCSNVKPTLSGRQIPSACASICIDKALAMGMPKKRLAVDDGESIEDDTIARGKYGFATHKEESHGFATHKEESHGFATHKEESHGFATHEEETESCCG